MEVSPPQLLALLIDPIFAGMVQTDMAGANSGTRFVVGNISCFSVASVSLTRGPGSSQA